jgi:RNA polymerase sigma-70 factor (ECF subfamily)
VEAAEFDSFYASTHPRVVRVVYALTGDRTGAQDIAQEAFVRAWDHRRSLTRDGNPEAWVTTTATRLAVSQWRRAGAAVRALTRVGVTPDSAGPNGDRVDLLAALGRLPLAQREAIVLHHLCDLSVEQVAREVHAPVGTVKARLSRGRAALALDLAMELPEDPPCDTDGGPAHGQP